MPHLRALMLCLLFLLPFLSGAQQEGVVADKETASLLKQMDKRLRGKWWLLHKEVSDKTAGLNYKQETRMYVAVANDTVRPLMRIEFKKKGILLVHEFPYMKARLAKEASYTIEVKTVSGNQQKYFLHLPDELKVFIGIREPIEISFVKKSLLFTDASGSLFKWRAD